MNYKVSLFRYSLKGLLLLGFLATTSSALALDEIQSVEPQEEVGVEDPQQDTETENEITGIDLLVVELEEVGNFSQGEENFQEAVDLLLDYLNEHTSNSILEHKNQEAKVQTKINAPEVMPIPVGEFEILNTYKAGTGKEAQDQVIDEILAPITDVQFTFWGNVISFGRRVFGK